MTQSEQNALRQRASALLARGEVDGARQQLLTLATQLPGDWLVRVQLAETYESQGDFSTALSLVQQAMAIAPTNLKLTAKLALVAQHSGDFALAAAHYAVAIDNDEINFGRLRLNLGHCCFALGDFEQAVDCYRQYLQDHSDHLPGRANLAMGLEKLFRFDEAAQQWGELAQREPANPRWPTLLGVLELKRERLREAQSALDQAARLGADDEIFLVNLASLKFEQRQFRQSLDLIDAHPELARRPDLSQLAFLNQFQLGLYDQCQDQLEIMLAGGNLESAMVGLSLLPQLYLDSGQPEAAARAQNFSGLVWRRRLALTPELAATLQQEILQHPSLAFEPITTSTHNGSQTQSLLVPGSAAVQGLLELICQQVRAYAAHARAADTAYSLLIPATGRIKIWAVALASGGYQGSHMHPHGIISGVYYLKVPSADDPEAGALELGCPEPKFDCRQPPQRLVQQVRDGDLLMFPSWCFHRTLPLHARQPRISIAFDVVPPDSPEWNDPGLSAVFELLDK